MNSKIKSNQKSVQSNTKKGYVTSKQPKKSIKRLDKNKELLIYLSKCQKKIRNSIIEKCSKDNLYSICECVLKLIIILLSKYCL